MKYYIIAGERSGDLHGSNLIVELKKRDHHAQIRALGGELMEKAGATIYRYYHEINYMGVWEVAKNIFVILKNLKWCKTDVEAYKPDVLILIDFGGFNMKMSEYAHKNGIKVFYYISPKIWAWNTGRAYQIRKYVDKMFVILPFEQAFYKKFDFQVDYVGNPVNDSIAGFVKNPAFESTFKPSSNPIIAILPGSRSFEVQNMFSEISDTIRHFKDYTFVIAAVSNLPAEQYHKFAAQFQNCKVVFDETYDLLSYAVAAVVTSGTASLETALMMTPHVVVYKTSWISYWIAKMVLKIPYVTLPNLILGREIVKELLQDQFKSSIVIQNLELLLHESDFKKKQALGYIELKNILGEPGTASKTAELMIQYLQPL
jgi:lipid-A-disaccharide synthase